MKITAALIALSVASVGALKVSSKSESIERILSSGKDGKSGKGKGKGKGKGGKGGSGNPCDICADGRPDSIIFKYLPNDPSGHDFEKHTCSDYSLFPTTAVITVKNKSGQAFGTYSVTAGDLFEVNSQTQGGFDADSFFEFDGWTGLDGGGNSCIVHTSCSDALLPGYENRIGPFELQGQECVPDECVICDSNNKNRPDVLTMIYNSAGADSMYQPIDKADCVAGSYPDSTTLTVMDKNGNVKEVITGVTTGMQIQIGEGYDLDAETHFGIAGWSGGSCFIHTSCSVPLVPGDQIGPFIMIEGNDCGLPEKCIVPDKMAYECGETISIGFDLGNPDPNVAGGPFAALEDDWIGIYPCDVPLDDINHAEVWDWSCGGIPSPGAGCTTTANGTIVFDSLPPSNANGPHTWPVAPYVIPATGAVNRCFKAYYLRNEGPSVPPYVPMCESAEFTITENGSAGCSIRQDGSPAQPVSHNAP